MAGIKEEALRIVEGLSDDATWDDLMYEIYVHVKVDRGRRDLADGKVVPTRQARQRSTRR